MGKIPILCIIGPTASGKSSRAVARAREYDGEVISVDSRQVYRTLDIGTEKISKEEMGGIPHHLIDIRDPEDTYSAYDFVQDASRLAEEIHARGKKVILAGGTHFYFDALINGLPIATPPNKALRDALMHESAENLYARVLARDSTRAKTLDPQNKRRLIRALEILEAHKSVPARQPATSYAVTWEVLLPEREELRGRIATRLEEALARGLIEEVRQTRKRVGDERLNELGLEYRVVGEFLRGERTEESLLPALCAKLFQYARRQEAWIGKLTS